MCDETLDIRLLNMMCMLVAAEFEVKNDGQCQGNKFQLVYTEAARVVVSRVVFKLNANKLLF